MKFPIHHQPPGRRRSVFGNYKPGQGDTGAAGAHEPGKGQDTRAPSPALTAEETVPPRCLQDSIDAAIARGFAYRFLAKAFEYPQRESWGWLCDHQVRQMLRLAMSRLRVAQAGPSPAEAELEELLARLTPEAFDDFENSYISVFGHAARGDCPLNEIEYGDIKADPLFQPHRLADLAAFYRAFGLELDEDAGERQDHICIELEFMSVLVMKEAYALENQLDEEPLAICRQAQKRFMREHLGRWTPAFTRRLFRAAGPGVLGALANFLREFAGADCRHFDVMPGSEDLVLRPVDEAAEALCASCGVANGVPGAVAPNPDV